VGSSLSGLNRYLNLIIGALAACIWAANGLQVAMGGVDVSVRGLFASVAFILTGLALGILLCTLTAPARARRLESNPDTATSYADLKTGNLLSALMLMGLVTALTLDTSMGIPNWTLLLLGSLVAGFVIGVAFAAGAVQPRRDSQVTSGVHRPARYDWR